MVQYTTFVVLPWTGECYQSTLLLYLQMDYRGIFSVATNGETFITVDLNELFGAEE